MAASRTAPLPRRAHRWTPAVLAAAVLLGGCGFALRQAPALQFQSVQLAGFAANSPLAKELRQNIESIPGTRVVEAASEAQVVLEALADTSDRAVVASTATGLVREFELRMRFEFKLRTPGGRELIGPTELTQVRDLSYNEGVALAKQYESASQFKAMQSDIVAQVMRRLAAVPKP
ncbi:MAG TPA: LPS assembly lipoprotein LptE [Burkholderiaceae bacterium]|nr:LPS assembly lipoprotein LptE [Burkholderiaceae bacterium]